MQGHSSNTKTALAESAPGRAQLQGWPQGSSGGGHCGLLVFLAAERKQRSESWLTMKRLESYGSKDATGGSWPYY